MKMPKYPSLIALFVLTLGIAGDAMAQDFKNFAVGAINLVAVADTPGATAPQTPPTQILVGLSDAQKAQVTGAQMANSVNTFVLKTPKGNYLFDTGLGVGNGKLMQSLASAGLTPADITAVVITHFHGDHIGGLLAGGKAAFPTAKLFVPKEEVEKSGFPADFLPAYEGRTTQFNWNEEILPGVTAMNAAGHTNGHTVYMIENGADKLLIVGDLIHFGGVQLPNPDVAVTYDTDTTKAIAARRKFFDMAASENLPIASMHLMFPGAGKLTKQAAGYTFAPLP